MITSPSQHIADILVAANLGALSGSPQWPIKLGKLSATPDQVVSISDSPGQSPNPKWSLDYPAVQVIIRSKPFEYNVGYTQARAIKDAVIGIDSYTSGDDRIVSTTMLGDVNYIGPDENNRDMFSLNIRLIIESTPGAGSHREPLPIN